MKLTNEELKEKYPHLWTTFHDPIAQPSAEYQEAKEAKWKTNTQDSETELDEARTIFCGSCAQDTLHIRDEDPIRINNNTKYLYTCTVCHNCTYEED
jgi:hypothetical protein